MPDRIYNVLFLCTGNIATAFNEAYRLARLEDVGRIEGATAVAREQ